MKTDLAWYNRGRWLVRCPVCDAKIEVKPDRNDEKVLFFCGSCYPDKHILKPKLLPAGGVKLLPSTDDRKKAAQRAYENDEIHEAVFVPYWRKVEELMRPRHTKHQGFYPGSEQAPNDKNETLKDLQREQKNDPMLSYLKTDKKRSKTDSKLALRDEGKQLQKKNSGVLSDKIFRSLQ